MKVFPTRSCYHLMPTLDVQQGAATIKTFTDGELYVRIDEDVARKHVAVLAATPPPGDNFLELYFLLDALQRAGAIIHLFFTYFGYARQDRAQSGEALSCEVLFRFLKTFTIEETKIIHIHNAKVREFYDFQDIILLDFYVPLAHDVDCVVAPDEGAGYLAHEIARRAGKDCVVVMKKERSEHEKIAHITIDGNLKNKKILLVDDMIATGGTISRAAQVAKEQGAQTVQVAATHGIFSGKAIEDLSASVIEQIFVTNTLVQHEHPKISVIDIAPMIDQFFW